MLPHMKYKTCNNMYADPSLENEVKKIRLFFLLFYRTSALAFNTSNQSWYFLFRIFCIILVFI